MLKVLIPILILIGTGVLLKKINFISEEVVAGMKKLAVNVFLPVLIFNVLGTAAFTKESIVIFLMSFVIHISVFAVGFLVKKLYKKEYKNFIPFVTVTFEGGMIGYGLMGAIAGTENMYYFATLDLAGAIFSFTVWVTLIGRVSASGEGKKDSIIKNMLTSPTLIAAITGLICGVTGLGKMLVESPVGPAYEQLVEYFTAPMTPVILICLGYGLHFSLDTLKDALIIVGQRILVLGTIVGIVLFVGLHFVEMSHLLMVTLIMFFCLPPSFLLTVYIKDKKTQDVISCVLSIYMVITLIVFGVLVAIY